jgi:hypothetical protein
MQRIRLQLPTSSGMQSRPPITTSSGMQSLPPITTSSGMQSRLPIPTVSGNSPQPGPSGLQNNSPQPGPSGLQKQSRPPTGDSDDSDFDSDEFARFMFPDGMTVDEREVDVLIQTDSQVKILFDL